MLRAILLLCALSITACAPSQTGVHQDCAVHRAFARSLVGPNEFHSVASPYRRSSLPPASGFAATDGLPPRVHQWDEPAVLAIDMTDVSGQLRSKPTRSLRSCLAGMVSFRDVPRSFDDVGTFRWSLSPVAFSEDGKHALLYAEAWCDGTCGDGAYYLFELQQSEWVLIGTKLLWVS